MYRVHTTGPLRRTILRVVMAALLLSQALGLLHRVAHEPPAAVHAVSAALAALQTTAVYTTRADAAEQGTAGGHWLGRLFAAHDADACASYDQLAHADFLWGQPPELFTPAATTAARSSNPAWQLAAQAAGYLARGPPRLA